MNKYSDENSIPITDLFEALSTPPTPPPPGVTLHADQVVTPEGIVVQLDKKPIKRRIKVVLKPLEDSNKKSLEPRTQARKIKLSSKALKEIVDQVKHNLDHQLKP